MSVLTENQTEVLVAVHVVAGSSIEKLAEYTGLRETAVARCVSALSERGMVVLDEHHRVTPNNQAKESPMGSNQQEARRHVVYEYAEAPTGTIHLHQQGAFTGTSLARTVCGRSANGWPMLDETMSGISATCGRCRQLAGVKGEVPS